MPRSTVVGGHGLHHPAKTRLTSPHSTSATRRSLTLTRLTRVHAGREQSRDHAADNPAVTAVRVHHRATQRDAQIPAARRRRPPRHSRPLRRRSPPRGPRLCQLSQQRSLLRPRALNRLRNGSLIPRDRPCERCRGRSSSRRVPSIERHQVHRKISDHRANRRAT